MNNDLKQQQGFTLIEVITGVTLTVILLSGMLSILSTSLITWTLEKKRINIQQTAGFAMDTIMRELRYAQDIQLTNPQSLLITKLNGETITFRLGGGLHANTLYMVIDKMNAIPAGGSSANPITENIVTNLQFAPYPQSNSPTAVAITIEVASPNTGHKQTLHTVGYPLNK